MYERKRGEFGDGLHKGYIKQSQVLERNLFFRLFHACNGDINSAVTKKIFIKHKLKEPTILDDAKLDNFYFGYLLLSKLGFGQGVGVRRDRLTYGRIYAMTTKYKPPKVEEYEQSIADNLTAFNNEWTTFLENVSKTNTKYVSTFIDKESLLPTKTFSSSKWLRSVDFLSDVKKYFK